MWLLLLIVLFISCVIFSRNSKIVSVAAVRISFYVSIVMIPQFPKVTEQIKSSDGGRPQISSEGHFPTPTPRSSVSSFKQVYPGEAATSLPLGVLAWIGLLPGLPWQLGGVCRHCCYSGDTEICGHLMVPESQKWKHWVLAAGCPISSWNACSALLEQRTQGVWVIWAHPGTSFL